MKRPAQSIWIALCVLLLAAMGCQALTNGPESAPTTLAPTATNPQITATTPPTSAPTNTPKPELTNDSIGDPYAEDLGNLGYDVQNYVLRMALDPAKTFEVAADVTIIATLTESNLSMLTFDFVGFEISSLMVNGIPADFLRTTSKLAVLLPEGLAAGESVSIDVQYTGVATRRPSRFAPFENHLGLFYPDGKSLYVLSEPDGARFWFPCNDHPRDKAVFRFEVTAPPNMEAVANGRLVEHENVDGGELYIWEHDFPMATYLATVAVGNYVRLESQTESGLLIRDYVFPESQSYFQRVFGNSGEVMNWFEAMLGMYPFEEFGHVTVNAGGVSLETQSIVLLSTSMINEAVMVHEMAHMWFGDWVSLDSWSEMWRNEGFATYFEFLWDGRDDLVGFSNEMDALAEQLASIPLEPLDDLSPGNLFGTESYIKGAVVVHNLRKTVGDEAFFLGLRTYLERYGGGTASDADFQAVMEEVSGMDLDGFFQEWLTK